MKILILGNGGREYAIGLALLKEKTHELFFAPGNGATKAFATNITYTNYEELAQFALQNGIDLTIVGPETPLTEGVVDVFKYHKLAIFGPSQAAARLEGSKAYMKNFLQKYNIPTARYIETHDVQEAMAFASTLFTPIVIKADGLCAGKGVIIAASHEEANETIKDMLSGNAFGDAGRRVVVEEFLDGYELSMFAICDGEDYILLPAAQDHKRLLTGDKGPNTGGMGAYSPTPLVDEGLYQKVRERVIRPTLDGMKAEGSPYEGVLFIGVMVVKNEPIILEYNVRFGDPECEVLMPLLATPASELFYKSATGQLKSLNVEFKKEYAVGVVMASGDYPYKNSIPSEIIVGKNTHENAHIVYAGVSEEDGKLFASGGRVLLGVGLGESIQVARDRAYAILGDVHFAGKQYRTDIAYQALR